MDKLHNGLKLDNKLLPKLECEDYRTCLMIAKSINDLSTHHTDYAIFAGRYLSYALEQHVKITCGEKFSERVEYLSRVTTIRELDEDYIQFVRDHKETIDNIIDRSRDMMYDYFSVITGLGTYLIKGPNDMPLESIQDLHMRVAIELGRKCSIEELAEIYRGLSMKEYSHATPTMVSAGHKQAQLSSCFLLDCNDDLDSIYSKYRETALLHKATGGCAVSMQGIRSSGSLVKGTGSTSSGVVQFMRGFEHNIESVSAGGRRSAACVVWLEPHHPEIREFVYSRTDKAINRFHKLSLGVMLNDTFMNAVMNNEDFYLLDPKIYPGLDSLYGHEYNTKYKEYVEIAKRKLGSGEFILGDCYRAKASDVWHWIKEAKSLSGLPYLINKDAVNKLSNQTNLGTIKISNLCCEIVQFCSEEETAVCVLGNINLPMFINGSSIDYNKLWKTSYQLCRNLNYVLRNQYMPVKSANVGSKNSMAIGIGYQGLSDVFTSLGLVFGDAKSREINVKISETIQHGALTSSVDMAKEYGVYPHYNKNGGSYLANGKFHHELCGYKGSLMWDWEQLRSKAKIYGYANSYVTAYMPTSTTSSWMGSTESFEPIMSAAMSKNTKLGSFVVINKNLVKDLEELGLWSSDISAELAMNDGKIEKLDLPQHIKDIYRSAWSIPYKTVIEMAADRQPFICQSQSLNYYIENATSRTMNTAFFYAWKKGLKTMSYYLHTREASSAPKTLVKKYTEEEKEICRRNAETGNIVCEACSC